jgi:hypothetical protein
MDGALAHCARRPTVHPEPSVISPATALVAAMGVASQYCVMPEGQPIALPPAGLAAAIEWQLIVRAADPYRVCGDDLEGRSVGT